MLFLCIIVIIITNLNDPQSMFHCCQILLFYHQETFQWNGITSKKKGQKWGMEKTPSLKRNSDISFSQVSSEMVYVEEKANVTDDMDFDELMPYSRLPKVSLSPPLISFHGRKFILYEKRCLVTSLFLYIMQEGDLIAYRLIELSSSWTPELCSFRVLLFLKFFSCFPNFIDIDLYLLFLSFCRLEKYHIMMLNPTGLC